VGRVHWVAGGYLAPVLCKGSERSILFIKYYKLMSFQEEFVILKGCLGSAFEKSLEKILARVIFELSEYPSFTFSECSALGSFLLHLLHQKHFLLEFQEQEGNC